MNEHPSEGVRPLRVAVVGCGRISLVHLETLRNRPDVEIVGVCDTNLALAHDRATAFKIPSACSDLAALLRESSPDVVHLLTPPSSHLALIRASATVGAHVYVEKPLAQTAAEAGEIVKISRAAGIRVCPGHNRLFDPVMVHAISLVSRGDIGRVVGVRAEQGYSYESAARGAVTPWSYTYDWGLFDNLMPHPLYLASFFLRNPEEPRVAAVDRGRVREAAVEEIRVLIPSSAAIAEVSLSLTQAPESNRLEILGTKGRILVDLLAMSVVVVPLSDLPSIVTRLAGGFYTGAQLAGWSLRNGMGIVSGRIKRYPGIRTLVGAFHDSIRSGGPEPIRLEDGVQNVRQLESIRRACTATSKRRVSESTPQEYASGRDLVTGATGFVGGHLLPRLVSPERLVRAGARLLSRATKMEGVAWIRLDLNDSKTFLRALDGVRTVYHCAALVGSPGSLAEYEQTNVEGTIALLDAAREQGVRDFIYLSSIGVYGMEAGRWVDESAPYDSRASERGSYTQTKLAAERAVLSWTKRRPLPRVVILRAGAIYGPRLPLPIGRLTLPSTRCRPLVAGSGRVPMPLTYVTNVADAMILAATGEAPTGSVFNIVDSPDLDQRAVARALREASHGRIRPLFVPYPIVWLMMFAIDLVSLARQRGLGTARYRLRRTLAPMRFACDLARKELAWTPHVELSEGLAATLTEEDGGAPFPS
jgi:predicted dehydrogenase/nucleoside-diphosphate-sugar epimerase